MVRADLVIEADQRVPVGAILGNREIERGPRRKHARAVRVVHLTFEAEEEVRLVLDDRSADDAAPVPSDRCRLLETLGSDEIIGRRQRVAGHLAEDHALELVGPRLGDGVDDGAARAAPLRVVHARDDLELLDGLERRAHLRPGAGAERVVRVVAAVHGDVVALRGLAGRDNRVVAHLVGWRELHARQQRDGREEVAVHRRELGDLLRADVAADFRARGVDKRRFRRHAHGFLERAQGHRNIDIQRLPDRQDQAVSFERMEARELGGDTVPAGRQL